MHPANSKRHGLSVPYTEALQGQGIWEVEDSPKTKEVARALLAD